MASERGVKVKLIADVDEYQAAMKRAAKRTRKLIKALRKLESITIRIRIERD